MAAAHSETSVPVGVLAMILDAGVVSSPAEDVRRERTRRRLAEAILELASQQSITTTTVQEVAARAGINRSTFYAHAASPMQLLTDTLSAELVEVHRSAMVEMKQDGHLYRDATRTVMHQILDHVLKHENIYAGPPGSSALFALRVVLADHVERSLLSVFREGFTEAPMDSDESLSLFASFLSHGVVGAVEAWLHLPSPRDRELLISAIEAMYPGWYALPSHREKVPKNSS